MGRTELVHDGWKLIHFIFSYCNRLVGKVEIVVDKNRVDGSRVRLAEVEVGDGTGSVSLRARDDQIDLLQEISDASGAVVLRNCTLELFQGKHIRLAVTKWGKLSRYPDQVASTPPPPSKINQERNFSLIDLSRVANPIMNVVETYGMSEVEGRQPQQQQHYHQSPGGRTQSFSQQNPAHGRRGNRRSSRNKPGVPGAPVPQQHYTDRYPGGLHGYGTGFVDSSILDPHQYSYNMRQQERHQHMMLQHQYGMQHQQMQHMYHPSQPGPPPPQQDHSRPPPQMLIPGISSPGSFDSAGFGQDLGSMPMLGTNPFMQHSQTYGQAAMPQQLHEPRSHESTPPDTPQMRPETPRMNPQAPKFDPSFPPPK